MEDYIKATKQKIKQLENEISKSSASDTEKRNMQHSLSKINIFSDDVFDDAIKYKERKIGGSIDGSYYIEVKIVTGGVLQSNNNQKLINEFKRNGFEFKGEPIIQSNDEVCWSFVEKNNNLIG